MFAELIKKLNDFQDHHQVIFAVIVICGVVCFSWGVEKLLEEYVFTKNSKASYITAIIIGLIIFFLTNHIVLNVL